MSFKLAPPTTASSSVLAATLRQEVAKSEMGATDKMRHDREGGTERVVASFIDVTTKKREKAPEAIRAQLIQV
jgi:hypothetical protein